MNERIRELAIKAGAGEWGDSVVPAMMDVGKFAELIVQECIKQVEKNFAGAVGTYAGAHNSAVLKCKKSIQ